MAKKSVLIGAGTDGLSAAVDLEGFSLVGFDMPAAWTAAVITLQNSLDGVTFKDVYNSDGTELSFTVAASRYVLLVPANVYGLTIVKFRSGTAATPVQQAATRAIGIRLQGI